MPLARSLTHIRMCLRPSRNARVTISPAAATVVDKPSPLCRNADIGAESGGLMTNLRAMTLGLLASTALATPALAQQGQSPAPGTNTTDVTSPPPKVQSAQEGQVPDQTEIVITATKREE